jgi:hypothetical protein
MRTNISQTIYFQEEIGLTAGMITNLALKFAGVGDIRADIEVSFWLANIPETKTTFNTATDWITYNQFTAVWVETPLPNVHLAGERIVNIELHTPFHYTGGNIALMSHRHRTVFGYNTENVWTISTIGTNRTIRAHSDTIVLNPQVPPIGTVVDGFPHIAFGFTPAGTVYFTVSGKIVLEDTGEGAEGIQVSLIGDEELYIETDSDGLFVFEDLKDNHTYELTVSFPKYTTYTRQITINGANQTDLLITLNEIIALPFNVTALSLDVGIEISWNSPFAQSVMVLPPSHTAFAYEYDVKRTTYPDPDHNTAVDIRTQYANTEDLIVIIDSQSGLSPGAYYYYFVRARYSGIYGVKLSEWVMSNQVKYDPVNESDTVEIPAVTSLLGNFPNPFNPETSISFQLSVFGCPSVRIEIFNIRGQVVRTLVNGYFGAGRHSVVWDGRDVNGNMVSSGVYFYQMISGDFIDTRKMLLMK